MISGDLVALFEPSESSWSPLGAPSVPFDMLKRQESNATAEKRGPAACGLDLGETLSKQVYLGIILKSGSSPSASRFATAVLFALKGSVAGFKGLRSPAAGPFF